MRKPFLPIFYLLCLPCFLLVSCSQDAQDQAASGQSAALQTGPLFQQLSPRASGVDFENTITEDRFRNILVYQYFYNGGGVAIGDVNNDGLSDLFFTGNMVSNALFLNQGGMKFSDESLVSGLKNRMQNTWCTGATMADVNADGWLDIYVCRAGRLQPENRRNWLYINRRDGTFSERAEEYGLNDPGYGVQAAFFDYDKDGDLDCFIVNHGIEYYGRSLVQGEEGQDPFIGDKLYRNDGGKFTDVSQESGIVGSPTSYGLGVGIADLNHDGWEDIYVSNDFFQSDYLYLNQGDGTFKESLKDVTRQLSFFGMGVELADLNNDTLNDIVVLDMTAEDHIRRKNNLLGISQAKFWDFVEMGNHYQYMYNSVQLNNGSRPDGLPDFSNIARLTGMSRTDWSWAPLLADFDNDGHKDLFVGNGLRKDVLNLDFINFAKKKLGTSNQDFFEMPEAKAMEILNAMPSEKIQNYLYRNGGNLAFENVAEDWGLGKPAFSTGAAYADLDNDGDLDLVINNIDDPAFLYENKSEARNRHRFLRVKLKGPKGNPLGVGAKVTVWAGDQLQQQHLQQTRGFQSAVEPVLHFGLGDAGQVDRLEVRWPDGKVEVRENVPARQLLVLDHADAKTPAAQPAGQKKKLFAPFTPEGLDFTHRENKYDDFTQEYLLPHRLSRFGPALAVGDANGDGLEDVFVGGAKGQAGQLFLQTSNGSFRPGWQSDARFEEVDAAFFDANGDGALDLYVVSGGYGLPANSPDLQDQLYVNDGKGNFSAARNVLPQMLVSGGSVATADYDGDGDEDLFVGGRVVPGKYPQIPRSYLLENQGGAFVDVTEEKAPALAKAGMVSRAAWTDVDGNQQPDLLLVGEWMAPSFFTQTDGQFQPLPLEGSGLEKLHGWWHGLAAADLDGDGDDDYLLGNMGQNYRFEAQPDAPFELYSGDFDQDGADELLFAYQFEGKTYPIHDRIRLSDRWDNIKRKYQDFASFAPATVKEVLGDSLYAQATVHQAQTFASHYVENLGGGKFKASPLPLYAQVSTVTGFVVQDVNQDGNPDVVLAGNYYGLDTETPRADAGIGLVLLGNGKGNWQPMQMPESGLYLPGDIKNLRMLRVGGKALLLAAENNGALKAVEWLPPSVP